MLNQNCSRFQKLFTIFLALGAINFSAQAQAQTETKDLVNKQLAEATNTKEGWTPDIQTNLNLSYGTSSNVIGQISGESVNYGGKLLFGLDYKSLLNEWRNKLEYVGSTGKNPAFSKFVKSSDQLNLNSLYQRSFEAHDWLGAYTQFDFKTPVFKGEDLRAQSANYQSIESGQVQNSDSLRLTSGFNPLKFKESLGMFFKILKSEKNLLEARVGYGALQIKANGNVLADDSATPNIEYRKLTGYSYSGAELGFNFVSQLNEKSKLTLKGEMLVPIGYKLSSGDNRSALEIADIDLKGLLTSQIADYLSFNYEIKAVKQPLLLDRFQLQAMGTLNFNYDFL